MSLRPAPRPMTPNNPLYLDNPVLLRRKASKDRRDGAARECSPDEARRFVMPWGRFQGYYLGAIVRHRRGYASWLRRFLSSAGRESAYDGIRISDALRLLMP